MFFTDVFRSPLLPPSVVLSVLPGFCPAIPDFVRPILAINSRPTCKGIRVTRDEFRDFSVWMLYNVFCLFIIISYFSCMNRINSVFSVWPMSQHLRVSLPENELVEMEKDETNKDDMTMRFKKISSVINCTWF